MNAIPVKTHEEMSERAALLIASQILRKRHSVIGFATGSTPELTYQKLVELYQKGVLDFSNIVSFNLDEYVGLQASDPQSYHYFMERHLFGHVNIKKENVHIPDGMCEDVGRECASYEERIRQAGGVDLQILGIGFNGHVGFNEPNEELLYETHEETLTASTLAANARFFGEGEEMPRKAISMGMGTILSARSVLLLASKGKEAILDAVWNGPITTRVPASMLRFHKDVTVIYVEP